MKKSQNLKENNKTEKEKGIYSTEKNYYWNDLYDILSPESINLDNLFILILNLQSIIFNISI